MRIPLIPVLAFAAVAASAIGLTSCSSSDGGDRAASDSTEVVMFSPTSSHPYLAAAIAGATEQLEADGYTLTAVENNFDQTEQDTQVQQYLASGEKPAGIIWWPADSSAGIASLSRLHQLGVPIVQMNQTPLPESEEYFTAYAGVNDTLNGQVGGQLAISARDTLLEDGFTLHSDGGNVLQVTGPPSYAATTNRLAGFANSTADAGFNVVGTLNADSLTPDAAYNVVAQSLQGFLAKGVDIVYGLDDNLAAGAAKALAEAGVQPGKDVAVVSSTCYDLAKNTVDGTFFATGLTSPDYEGLIAASTLATLIGNGGTTDGDEYEFPADPDSLPDLERTPAKYNYLPNPPITGAFDDPATAATNVASFKLWGQGIDQLCNF